MMGGMRLGSGLLGRRKGFTTEDAEDHGAPRRFFGFAQCAFIQAKNHFMENDTAHAIVSVTTQNHLLKFGVARCFARRKTPWPSVVLRVLRGESLPRRSRTQAWPRPRIMREVQK